jgi:hypothetical protein
MRKTVFSLWRLDLTDEIAERPRQSQASQLALSLSGIIASFRFTGVQREIFFRN